MDLMPSFSPIASSRPFIFINSAMSADGKIATKEHKQMRISGANDFARVDRLRAISDAIMVGVGTVLSDDPSLTVKSSDLRKERIRRGQDENPVRIVVDSKARTSPNASIFEKGEGRKIVVVSKSASPKSVEILSQKADIIVAGESCVDIHEMCSKLYTYGIRKLMVEGGATLNFSLIEAGVVDEIFQYVGNKIIGGFQAPTFSDGAGFCEYNIKQLRLKAFQKIDDGILIKWSVQNDF